MIRLPYQPPYHFRDLLAFFGVRALENVEIINDDSYMRAVAYACANGPDAYGWIRVEDNPDQHELILTISESLEPFAQHIAERIRYMFDTECAPSVVAASIASLADLVPKAAIEGIRLPGCFSPFETACRAVLGQQVSVKAANKLAARIVAAYGDEVQTGIKGLTRIWPTPERILSLEPIEDAFGALGVIRTRSRVIAEIARKMSAGELELNATADAQEQIERLLEIKGIGPWSANYIAMRAMSYPDAFLETDVGVAHALPDLTPKERLSLAEVCRPWRSYAVLSLWDSLSA